jgi:hypothetical protein
MPRRDLVIEAGEFRSDDDDDDTNVAGDSRLVIATGSDASSLFAAGGLAGGGGGGGGGSSSLAAGGRASSFSLFADGGPAAGGGGSSSLAAGTLSSFAMVDDGTSLSFALRIENFSPSFSSPTLPPPPATIFQTSGAAQLVGCRNTSHPLAHWRLPGRGVLSCAQRDAVCREFVQGLVWRGRGLCFTFGLEDFA